MEQMSLPSTSGQPAPAVEGEGLWTLDRIRDEATTAEAEQKWELNANCIQFARWCFENPFGCPSVSWVPISMKEPWAEIIQSIQADGPSVGFPHGIKADGQKRAWSWRAFVNAMEPEEAERVVGLGLVGISVYPRPGTFDHHRAQVAKTVGQDLIACGGRPPIWDFKFDRSDGSSVLVHPRTWDRFRSLEFAVLEECQQVPGMPTGWFAPPLPPLSPSPPLHRVLLTDQAQPASSPSGGPTRLPPWLPPPPARPQVAVAPPVGGQAAVTTAKAAVPVAKAALPVLQAIVPAAHAATGDPDCSTMVTLCSNAEAYAALKVVPPLTPPSWIWWRGQWWSSRWRQGSSQGWRSSEWWSSQDWQ